MANGIANNENEEKKITKRPAGQNEKSVVCVARLAKTDERGLDGAGKPVRGCKEQLQNGEYVTIKLSDKPLQIKRNDNETVR